MRETRGRGTISACGQHGSGDGLVVMLSILSVPPDKRDVQT